jgi:hypothetical protein
MPTDSPILGTCPDCGSAIAPRLRVVLESAYAAAKRPVTPELLALCPQCRKQFVVSLAPALSS